MIVIDASIAVDWYTNPTAAVSNAAFYEVIVSGATVPGNFHGEVVQALLRAVRTGRMRDVEMEANVADLEGLEYNSQPLMPSDYSSTLSHDELNNVVSYLMKVANVSSSKTPKKADEWED